jgi:hypothetical protein
MTAFIARHRFTAHMLAVTAGALLAIVVRLLGV